MGVTIISQQSDPSATSPVAPDLAAAILAASSFSDAAQGHATDAAESATQADAAAASAVTTANTILGEAQALQQTLSANLANLQTAVAPVAQAVITANAASGSAQAAATAAGIARDGAALALATVTADLSVSSTAAMNAAASASGASSSATAAAGSASSAQTSATNAAASAAAAQAASQTTNSLLTNIPNGTASSPSLSFSNEQSTGWYRKAIGLVGMAIGGVEKFVWSAAGLLLPTDPTQNLHAATKQYVDSHTFTTAAITDAGQANGAATLDANGLVNVAQVRAMPRQVKSGAYTLAQADLGGFIDCTGVFTLGFPAASTLGARWFAYVGNYGAGAITIPSSDGVSNWLMYPGEVRLFLCDGTNFYSRVVNPFWVEFTASGAFIVPPGYATLGLHYIAGAGGGITGGYGGAGGAGFYRIGKRAEFGAAGASLSFTVGAAGTGGGNPTAGGSTSVTGFPTVNGGGAGTTASPPPSGGSVSGAPIDSINFASGTISAGFFSGSSKSSASMQTGAGLLGGGNGGKSNDYAGSSVFGGGGGADAAGHVGLSMMAGAGGINAAGNFPGGGGGPGFNGAPGCVRFWGVA